MYSEAPAPVIFSAAQAQNCSTFVAPPLDGSMLVNEMIDWHLERSKDHVYATIVGEGEEANGSVTYAQLGQAVHSLGHYFLETITEGPSDADGKPRVVSLFTGTDSLTYSTTVLALSRAGFQPFPLSTRNSVPALAHLISKTSCHYLVGSIPTQDHPAASIENTTQALLLELESSKHSIVLLESARSIDLYPHLHAVSGSTSPFETAKGLLPPVRSLPSFSNATMDWPWVIIHSSGSTSFPKPIYILQRTALQWLTWPWAGETDIANKTLGTMATPSFHAMGIAMHIGAPLTSGAIASFFKPTESPRIATAWTFLDALRKVKANFATVLPSFLEEWSQDEKAVRDLTRLDAVTYGAGPLSQVVGDKLVEAGVNLQNSYGLTEMGVIFKFFPLEHPGKDWQYGRFCAHLKPRLIPDGVGNVALHLMECDTHSPSEHNLPGERGYDTHDLLREHPTKKGYFKVVGRADDQIMMANGEKTNPEPLELIIEANPLVRGAFMFGHSRLQTGVVVEPVEPIDTTVDAEIEKFRNAIWASVEKANAFAPSHSRIFKEYILVSDPVNKPFPRTPKGAVRRKAALRDYEAEINSLYDEVDQATKGDWAQLPTTWDENGLRDFVNRVIDGTVGSGRGNGTRIEYERDLFSQGCDSLQATYIRTALIKALRHAPQASTAPKKIDLTSKISTSFVFEYPTQKAIETFLVELVLHTEHVVSDQPNLVEKHKKAMLAMISKYTADFPTHQPLSGGGMEPVTGEVVLITGTTGSLGTYLLACLLKDPRVSRIYALNRSRDRSLPERQMEAFKDRGVDLALLSSPKLRLVVGEVSKPNLEVSEALYEEIRDSITVILHNAWRLDFNLSLASFEPHVQGVRNLINLAIASTGYAPPQFLFTSSTATLLGWKHDRKVPEQSLDDPRYAIGTGYGESKWVSERILVAASKETGLRTTCLRIGQLSGSTVNGAWSTTDWVPLMVQTGRTLNKLPTFPQQTPVTWMPVDTAADAITDILFVPATGNRYLHILHPHPAEWSDIFRWFASMLVGGNIAVELVSYPEWYTAVEARLNEDGAVERIPVLRFLDFFRGSALASSASQTDDNEAMGMARLETVTTESISPSLRNAPALDDSDVLRWLTYWENHGLFD